ncbi:hypothetical protein EVAR_5552_1 [Eumeta japonica]|uniref:Uncharacterized protein n=1 Tax=Eumeta variegata TaxID=151549 RepID=A0A4C1U1E4_EUMVA|nr:hypothetical protein EVAR_5552_1 [Eumeta japonica]
MTLVEKWMKIDALLTTVFVRLKQFVKDWNSKWSDGASDAAQRTAMTIAVGNDFSLPISLQRMIKGDEMLKAVQTFPVLKGNSGTGRRAYSLRSDIRKMYPLC